MGRRSGKEWRGKERKNEMVEAQSFFKSSCYDKMIPRLEEEYRESLISLRRLVQFCKRETWMDKGKDGRNGVSAWAEGRGKSCRKRILRQG